MNRRWLDLLLALFVVALSALAVKRSVVISAIGATVPVPPRIFAAGPPSGGRALEAAVSIMVTRNPFRLSRTPAIVRIGRPLPTVADDPSPRPLKLRPAFVIRAIVGGPPWSALIEGMPGVAGAAVVREGTQQGELTVRDISRDTVTIAGPDTVWKLTVKRSAP